MKKVTTILMLLVLMCAGAWAQTVINIGSGQGTYYNKDGTSVTGGFNAIKFVSSSTPAVTLEADADHPSALHSSDGRIGIEATVTTFTISVPEGYRIKEYQFEAKVVNNSHPAKTFTPEGEEAREIPTDQTWRTYAVTNVNAQSTTFTLASSAWSPINSRNFTVTVEEEGVTEEQVAAFAKIGEWLPLLQNQALVTNASDYISNAIQSGEGSYAALLDKNNTTYFHSAWSGTMSSVGGHDLQARLPEAVDAFHLYYVTRNNGTGYPQAMRIDGSNNAADFTDAAAGGTSWTDNVSSLSELPSGATKAYLSDKISLSSSYQYLRFVPDVSYKSTNWFCLAEFWLLPSNETVDAAISMMKSVNSAIEITGDMVATINQIDTDLRNTMVTVTYNFVDNGTTVNTMEVTQAKNSNVNIPAGLITGYSELGYDFVPSQETVGTTDCTITVTATPKPGVVTDLSTLSNDKTYTLTSRRGVLSTDGSNLTTNTTGANFKSFAIVAYEEKSYLWSVEDSKWVKKDGTFTTNVADIAEESKMVLTADGVRGNLKPLFYGGIGNHGINTNAGGHVAINTWTTRDDGNEFVITETGDFAEATAAYAALDAYFNPSYTINYVVKDESGATLFTANDVPTTEGANITTLPEAYQRSLFYTYNTVDVTITESVTTIEFTATPKEDAPFEFTADTSAPVWYNLTLSAAPNYVTYVAGGDQNVQLPTTLTDDETTQWAFIGNPYDGFQLVNKAAGTDLVLGSGTTTGSGNTGGNTYATLQSKGSQVNEVWTAKASTSISGKNGFFLFNTENHALNKRNGTANISYWTGGYDAGSTFVATKVLTDEEKYNELIALLESYELGDDLHQYNVEGKTISEATSDIANLKAAGYTPENMTAAQALADAMRLNMPQANTFLRIKGKTSGKYLAAGTASNGKYNMTDAEDATTIFLFTGTKLINYSNGFGNGMTASSWAWTNTGMDAASDVEFQDGLNNRGYGIKSATANFYDNGDGTASADRGGNVTINAGTNARYVSWQLEKVTELPVTLHESETKEGYSIWVATFSAPVGVVSVDGAEVHKVTDTGSAFFCEPTNTRGIPAGKGALLVSETEMETVTVTLGETDDDFETALSPLYACEKGKTGLFLGKVEGSEIAGLYPIDSETLTGGFKAFVDDSTGEGKELVFDQDPTGIENIEHGTLNMNNGAIYNLQGQKVNKAQKGVFIQNGKKVVVK